MIAFSSTLVFHVFFTFYVLYFYLSFSCFITLFFCSFLFFPLLFLLYFSLLIYFMSLYVSSSLLVFFLLFTCVVLFLYFHFAVPLLVFFLFFTFDLLFPFPVLPFFKLRTSFLDQNSFHNSYLVNLVCVVLIIIHILYTMLAEHGSKTRLLPRDIRLGCRPDLSSKVGEKRST